MMARLVLLDRDGTINVDTPYVSSPEQIELLPGAGEAIRLLRELGLAVVVVTNQSAIARGYLAPDGLDAVHQRLNELLARHGAAVDAIYVCPHGPEDGCACRKPAPGLAHAAAQDFSADLARAFVVGDKECDMGLAEQIGATAIRVLTGATPYPDEAARSNSHYVVKDLGAAALLIQRLIEDGQGT
jgi:D-glycero-D-manno-heptose 1,7-bisphosphate phosphatase